MPESFAACGEFRFTLNQNKDRLAIAGLLRNRLAGFQLIETKTDIGPVRVF